MKTLGVTLLVFGGILAGIALEAFVFAPILPHGIGAVKSENDDRQSVQKKEVEAAESAVRPGPEYPAELSPSQSGGNGKRQPKRLLRFSDGSMELIKPDGTHSFFIPIPWHAFKLPLIG